MSYDFDLVCIGSGPAGQRAAVQAAKLGKRVAVIGIEYAAMLAAVGVRITLIERRERPLEFLDHEIVDELIHVGQAVMGLGGGLSYFLNTVFNYPTLAECYKVAGLDAANKMHA